MLRAEEQIGPYTLIRQLGKGSFGFVWLAERRGKFLTTQVAVKIPIDDEPDLEAIRQEAQSWLQASGHPNVLPVLDADEYEGRIVIVSEYAPDGSLSDWLRRHDGKAPSLQAALDMACGTLAGLEHLHSRRMIHRDLKPGNVLLQGETPRLTDFGVSRVLQASGSTRVAGTPAYMAPEMFDGVFSEKTDLWAAGIMLHKMLTGTLPFTQQGWGALYAAIKEDTPAPLPPEIPDEICAVVSRAMTKDPAARFDSAREMRLALTDAAARVRLTDRAGGSPGLRDERTHALTPGPVSVPGFDVGQNGPADSAPRPSVRPPILPAIPSDPPSGSSASGRGSGSASGPIVPGLDGSIRDTPAPGASASTRANEGRDPGSGSSRSGLPAVPALDGSMSRAGADASAGSHDGGSGSQSPRQGGQDGTGSESRSSVRESDASGSDGRSPAAEGSGSERRPPAVPGLDGAALERRQPTVPGLEGSGSGRVPPTVPALDSSGSQRPPPVVPGLDSGSARRAAPEVPGLQRSDSRVDAPAVPEPGSGSQSRSLVPPLVPDLASSGDKLPAGTGSLAGAIRPPAGFDSGASRTTPGSNLASDGMQGGFAPRVPGLDSGSPPAATGAAGRSSSKGSGRHGGSAASSMRIHMADGAAMAWIAAGEFAMGDSDLTENPRRRVALDGFWIYRDPVTVAMFRRFCAAAAREMPDAPPWGWIDDHPMVNVHWKDAVEYCRWARVALPTEEQWEKAARGADARRFPWGNGWDQNRCRCSVSSHADARSTVMVGAHPTGASPYGVMDMAGNVWEWCHEAADSGGKRAGASDSPRRVLRGGSWASNLPYEFRTSFRQRQFPEYMYFAVGFRCVLNADSA
ncbi:MAG TPA: SUMF1/EgtB/PvdO family nonheme iron enzyme [Chthonomonadaceae bacterium]|nr:SUMF1/EgtB/PvdO family nonheme iron enzyme [Chthonomonadaceae bacterium]